jgi:hypothetical protein
MELLMMMDLIRVVIKRDVNGNRTQIVMDWTTQSNNWQMNPKQVYKNLWSHKEIAGELRYYDHFSYFSISSSICFDISSFIYLSMSFITCPVELRSSLTLT